MNTTLNLRRSLLVLALSSIYPVMVSAATSAGVAQFIAGDVSVRTPDGKTDALLKGKDIESGQAIVTGVNGRAQVKFSDGGLISLQPNTEFKIANYVDQADPKEDRFLVDLLRGSMRAITGLIGKRNRANYKVTTTTATIGIRGSGFSAGYNPDGSLGVTAEKDAIEVCSGGTCVGVVAGESVRVNSSTEPPVRTVNRATVPTPGPAQDVVTIGNQTTSDGKSPIIQKPSSSVTALNSGVFTNLKVVGTYYITAPTSLPPGQVSGPGVASSATLDDGKLTAFSASGNYSISTSSMAGSAGTIAGGDFIGWGTWATGIKNPGNNAISDLSYIVGQPTLVMPTTGSLNYTVIGQTPVTGYDMSLNAAIASGTLTSATLNVNFTTSKVAVGINTTLGNISVSNISVSNGQFSYTNGGPFINLDGIFTGVNASRAGLVYTGANANTRFSGAVAFKAP
jgi:hypothetical protein